MLFVLSLNNFAVVFNFVKKNISENRNAQAKQAQLYLTGKARLFQ